MKSSRSLSFPKFFSFFCSMKILPLAFYIQNIILFWGPPLPGRSTRKKNNTQKIQHLDNLGHYKYTFFQVNSFIIFPFIFFPSRTCGSVFILTLSCLFSKLFRHWLCQIIQSLDILFNNLYPNLPC